METLDELEKLLQDLRGRFFSGDKTVEVKLRALAVRVAELRTQQPQTVATVPVEEKKSLASYLQFRKRCCGR